MELLQLIVELRNGEPFKLFSPYEQLYQSLTGKPLLAEKTLQLPGFSLDIEDKKMRIIVDPLRTSVVLGDVPNAGYCADNVRAVYRKTSEVVNLPPVQRLGARTYWIDPDESEASKLINTCKKALYKENALIDEAVDIGASFSFRDGDYDARLSCGPMEKSQLETMLAFKRTHLPKVCVFYDLDYYRRLDKIEIDEKLIHDFVIRAISYAEKQSNKMKILLNR